MSILNLAGQKFGRLTVLHYVPKYKHLCRCKCGIEKVIFTGSLVQGLTKSCGCLHREMMTHHGLARSATYTIWHSMKQRCRENHISHKNYFDRGIRVCRRWQKFKNFLEDMGERPSASLTLDRINNDKGYSKSNCRWVTRSVQTVNQRPKFNRHAGERICLSRLARKNGLNPSTVKSRLMRGWSWEDATTLALKQSGTRRKASGGKNS